MNENNASASFLAEKLKRMKGLSPEEMQATMHAYLLNERNSRATNFAEHSGESQVICLPGMRVL